ncbi:MAG: glycosyltransferase family 2 protein [Bradyrhizobiaceae bacterium]|nr:MAG: glycosyltransferase family 2 protein [Bradyrhizobiaceae bacterium]
MNAPAVSVVVPCYNAGRYLDALLASLSAQTFRDFETVIVDDGSTDAVTREKLAAIESGIRVVRQQNRGLSGARNTGFREARGNHVLPLDCDDQLDPAFLAETHAALAAAPSDVGFAFTHMRLVGARTGVRPCRFDRFDQLFINDLPYGMLIRRSAWEAVGGYDEDMREGYEDWEFNIRLAAAGYRGLEVAKPLLVYTVNPGGMLLSISIPRHGTLWRRIRAKHRDLFRPTGLWSLWRARGDTGGRVSLAAGAALLLLAKTLPERWFGRLFHRALLTTRWWDARRRDHVAQPSH